MAPAVREGVVSIAAKSSASISGTAQTPSRKALFASLTGFRPPLKGEVEVRGAPGDDGGSGLPQCPSPLVGEGGPQGRVRGR
jgi:hypothetical protein